MGTNINEKNICDFFISYNGALLNRTPHAGRTINLELTTDLPSRNYGLRIYDGDGLIDSFGNNKNYITFGFGTANSREDRVISNISAKFDRSYKLEAKRSLGLWSFYIDNNLIGTTQEDMQCNNLTQLTFF